MWNDDLEERLEEEYVGRMIKKGIDIRNVPMAKRYKGYIDFASIDEDGDGSIDVCICEKRYGDYGEMRNWTACHVLNIRVSDFCIDEIEIDDRVYGDEGLGGYDPATVFSYDAYFDQARIFLNKITEKDDDQ